MSLTTDRPLTCSVPEAGKILGLGRDAAYRAAQTGEIPIIRIGRLVRVPLAALERLLDEAGAAADRRRKMETAQLPAE
jgi:excisionase family DNA binding protein